MDVANLLWRKAGEGNCEAIHFNRRAFVERWTVSAIVWHECLNLVSSTRGCCRRF